ncbi:4033_t:CDS:2, partial [Racocetra fulgida]
ILTKPNTIEVDDDDNNDYIEESDEEITDCTEDGRPMKRNKKKSKKFFPKSVARTEKASELTFSHPYKEILKILQINYTSFEISEDEAETSAKKRGRKKLYVPEMAFRSEEAIRIIEQIDQAIRVDESVQPDERIRITQEDEHYTSLVAEIPESKINKLPSWAVCKGAICTSSSDNSSSSS